MHRAGRLAWWGGEQVCPSAAHALLQQAVSWRAGRSGPLRTSFLKDTARSISAKAALVAMSPRNVCTLPTLQ